MWSVIKCVETKYNIFFREDYATAPIPISSSGFSVFWISWPRMFFTKTATDPSVQLEKTNSPWLQDFPWQIEIPQWFRHVIAETTTDSSHRISSLSQVSVHKTTHVSFAMSLLNFLLSQSQPTFHVQSTLFQLYESKLK